MPRPKTYMPKPGVVKDETELAAAPRWTDSDRIRFVRGLPQKLGGWAAQFASTFDGKCRGMLSWIDNNNAVFTVIGTHKRLQVIINDVLSDITPVRETGTLANDPFTMVSGSKVVTVTDASHPNAVDDLVIFAGAAAAHGITIDGEYTVTASSPGSYQIEHSSAATSSGTGGGASVTYEYLINVGLADSAQGLGYGVGGYNEGTYGTARATGVLLHPRVWFIEQWGQNVVVCPRGGNIYEWTRNPSVRAQLLTNAPTTNLGIFVTEEKHLVALQAGGDKTKDEWSDQDGNNTWTPSDQNTAGGRSLSGGSQMLAGLRVRGTNLIFMDSGVWTKTFIGGGDVFGFFQVAGGASGIVAPHAACEVDGIGYWQGANDFYLYDGIVRRMPNSKDIQQFVFGDLNTNEAGKIFCVANTLFSEIWWFYASANSTEIDRYVKYNYDKTNRAWDVGALSRTAGEDKGIFPNPLMAGADDIIYKHESGVDDVAAAMGEFIEGSPIELGEGIRLMDVAAIIPDFKNLSGIVELTVLTREYPQSPEAQTEIFPVSSTTEQVNPRTSGRQLALRVGSSVVGTNWRYGKVRIALELAGSQ